MPTNNTVTKGTKLSKNRTVIRKLSFALRPRCPIFVYGDAIFALPGTFSLVTAVRFSNGQEALSLTTAAQNIHVLFRKSPLCRSHFFEWLKTAISSTACGTATLKSPPPRGSDAPHVHPRLRKPLARCTLDCGSKTSESPALRGFVAERGPVRGTSLYLVLKSNGPHRSKNPPVKFVFSPKTIPANIAKKLPPQRCFKPLFIAFFNFSHKRPTFDLTPESGYTLGFRRKIAHSGSHGETGAFPPSSTAGLCAASEIALSAAFVTLIPQRFYIHTFPGSLWPPLSATALPQTIFHRVFQLLPQMAHVRFHRRKWVHTRLSEKNRTQGLTRRNRGVSDGGGITTLGAFYTFRKPCVAGV